MIKRIAKPEKVKTMHEDNRVITAIQLMRIVATIRYNNIAQIKIMEDKDYDVSIHIQLIFNHAASLYEGIKTFFKLGIFLKDLESFKKNSDKIKKISRQWGSKTSFIGRILFPIRNEVAFHFDEKVINENLADYLKFCIENNKEVVLISGSSERVKDASYRIADNVTVNYILDKIAGKDLPVEEKVKRFTKELLELSGSFLEVLEILIVELFDESSLVVND